MQATLTAVTVQLDPDWERVATAPGVNGANIESHSPARGLCEFAKREGADLVVLGSARNGKIGQVLVGSVAMSLLSG